MYCMEFTNKSIEKLAAIARIHLTDEQKSTMRKELGVMVDWVNQLKKIDTTQVAPHLTMCTDQHTILASKQQVEEQPLEVQKALLNAPVHDGAYFHVPAVSTKKVPASSSLE